MYDQVASSSGSGEVKFCSSVAACSNMCVDNLTKGCIRQPMADYFFIVVMIFIIIIILKKCVYVPSIRNSSARTGSDPPVGLCI